MAAKISNLVSAYLKLTDFLLYDFFLQIQFQYLDASLVSLH